MAVCSEIHTKQINILCGQKVEFLSVTSGGTYSNHCAVHIVTTALQKVKTISVFCPRSVFELSTHRRITGIVSLRRINRFVYTTCDIWGYHSAAGADSSLLERDAVSIGKWLQTFRKRSVGRCTS